MNARRDPQKPSTGWLSRISRPKKPRTTPPEKTPTSAATSATPKARRAPYAVSGWQVLASFSAIAIMALACIYHLYVRFEGIHSGYETGKERRVQAQLLLERRELRLEMASLKEQRRIEAEARQRLGMEVAPVERIVSTQQKRKAVAVSGGAL
ncbi:MAG: hypothetical protein GX146_05640 [Myxococcales bacterium]|jgi:cell division protein FtsL|nr:hypothetical protein [Myxococcales bacterium]